MCVVRWPVVESPPCQQAAGIVQDKPARLIVDVHSTPLLRYGPEYGGYGSYLGPGEKLGYRRSRLAGRALHTAGWQTTKEKGQIQDEADGGRRGRGGQVKKRGMIGRKSCPVRSRGKMSVCSDDGPHRGWGRNVEPTRRV